MNKYQKYIDEILQTSNDELSLPFFVRWDGKNLTQYQNEPDYEKFKSQYNFRELSDNVYVPVLLEWLKNNNTKLKTNYGQEMLYNVAVYGSAQSVEKLLDNGLSVDFKPDGSDLFDLLIHNVFVSTKHIDVLLKHKIDIKQYFNDVRLANDINNHTVKYFNYLLKHFDGKLDCSVSSVLEQEKKFFNEEFFNSLISKGASTDDVLGNVWTEQQLKYFIQKGAKVKLENIVRVIGSDIVEPQMQKWVCRFMERHCPDFKEQIAKEAGNIAFNTIGVDGSTEKIQYLLEKGMDVNVVNNHGDNLLQQSIYYKDIKNIEFLLSEGINPLHKNGKGLDALQYVEHCKKDRSYIYYVHEAEYYGSVEELDEFFDNVKYDKNELNEISSLEGKYKYFLGHCKDKNAVENMKWHMNVFPNLTKAIFEDVLDRNETYDKINEIVAKGKEIYEIYAPRSVAKVETKDATPIIEEIKEK